MSAYVRYQYSPNASFVPNAVAHRRFAHALLDATAGSMAYGPADESTDHYLQLGWVRPVVCGRRAVWDL